jgi:putative phosphoesterase
VLAVVLADTHLKASSKRGLPDRAIAHLKAADVILHAGDVTERSLLDELAGFGPVHAVLGNNDTGLVLPDTELVDLDGVTVGMIHDSGPRIGRAARMRKRFPTAAVVVFGHSHIPWNETGVDGQLLFNPGSPTQRRAQPHPTLGLLELRRGAVRRHEIVTVD